MRTVGLGVLATVVLCCTLGAAPVSIPSTLVGVQSVQANSFPNLICPSGVNGCGGAFGENIGSGKQEVTNATIWCVDSELNVTPGEKYTADIVSLQSAAATFDSANSVRYGGVTNKWVYSLASYGLGKSDALTRYRLAAILVSQYVPAYNEPLNGAENQSIQRSIWRLTDNTLYGGSLPNLSGNISTGAPAGYNDWIAYASKVMNRGTFDFGKWAVVSGGFDNGAFDVGGGPNSKAVQTFLVQVTPEPSFYAALILTMIVLLYFAARRRGVSSHS